MDSIHEQAVVPAEMHGQRLDKALAVNTPDLSLRARRRLLEEWDVRVNGRPRPKGYTVSAGDVITVRPPADVTVSGAADALPETPVVAPAAAPEPAVAGEAGGKAKGGSDAAGAGRSLNQGGRSEAPADAESGNSRVSSHSRAGDVSSDEGDVMSPPAQAEGGSGGSEDSLPVEIVAENEMFAALRKPGGLHSAAIAGRLGDCVERRLPGLFPGRFSELLNRLDGPTSGLLLVGLQPDAGACFRELEDAGKVRKFYLAMVHGSVLEPFTVTNALDTANRAVTKVLEDAAEPLRHTLVEPLGMFPGRPFTLVRAEIRKGARHQIRVHLAHAGHPILGDAVYGRGEPGDILHLHHCRLVMPGFKASCAPGWPDFPAADRMLDLKSL